MVVVVAVLTVIVIGNVVLTMAVLRRLAAHERKLAALAPILGAADGLSPGEALPAFLSETAAGERIDESHLGSGPATVAFFSAHCETCLDHAPQFAELVEREGVPALAVVAGNGPTAAPLMDALDPLPVVRELALDGALTRSFRVDAFPTYFAVDNGHVVAWPGPPASSGCCSHSRAGERGERAAVAADRARAGLARRPRPGAAAHGRVDRRRRRARGRGLARQGARRSPRRGVRRAARAGRRDRGDDAAGAHAAERDQLPARPGSRGASR